VSPAPPGVLPASAPSPPGYAELHCISSFSFLRGASQPQELVRQANELCYTAIAITDECTLAGMVRAHVAARDAEMQLIVGSEFRLDDGGHVVLLAMNRDGYGNLSEIVSLGRTRAPKGEYRSLKADFAFGVENCILLIVPDHKTTASDVQWWAERFKDHCWIAVELLQGPDDQAWLVRMRELSQSTGLPLVASGDVHMHIADRKPLQDVVTAVRLGKTVNELGRDAFPNNERHLRERSRLAELYPPDMLAATVKIAKQCCFSMAELGYYYPPELVPEGETPASHLRNLTEQGLQYRYPQGTPPHVRTIVEKELALIEEKRFEAFFLTVHEIVVFARSQHILCQGRGSAANSVVCYALRITEVDPSQFEVLFERFISRERNEEPDIDVDFEHQRREEVIQHIYEKYGRHRTAIAATVIAYRRKSALRDVGKAMGLSLDQVNRLSQTLAWWDRSIDMDERLREAGFDPRNPLLQQIVMLAMALRGFPRHLSQHVGGFVIAADKLARMVPIQNAAMENRSVIEWDKDDLEALGLLKVDVLALGMLTAIRRTFDALHRYDPSQERMTLASIPKEDDATYKMIQDADTIGVFQIESRAQMSMLPRLKPKVFYDLVIEVAIVRPGPIQGGMVHPYLRRRNGVEPVDYPKEEIKAVLKRTLGVPIFQEQVMKLAEVAAGFTPGEADMLRRAMAAWKHTGDLGPFRDKLFSGMLERGYQPEYIERIYKQIQGFGEYGFPESHAASFALLAYDSAWLKRHHPAAFACGLLNSYPMGFYSPSQIVQDIARHDVEVLPVDVTISDYETILERGSDGRPAVRLGLHMVASLAKEDGKRIAAANQESVFTSIEDAANRARLDARALQALASAEAFRSISSHRRDAHWQALGIEQGTVLMPKRSGDKAQADLIRLKEGENILEDYRSVGLSLRRHPMAVLRPRFKNHVTATQLRNLKPGRMVRATGIVTGRQRPGTASGVVFVTLEDETGNINVVVWSSLVDKQRRELLGSKLMTVHGKLEREGEVIHLIAHRLVDDSKYLGRLDVASRDFH
jgi:error-prone DNA polymerase